MPIIFGWLGILDWLLQQYIQQSASLMSISTTDNCVPFQLISAMWSPSSKVLVDPTLIGLCGRFCWLLPVWIRTSESQSAIRTGNYRDTLFNSQSYHFMLVSRHRIPPFYTFSTAIRGALVLLVDDVEVELVLVEEVLVLVLLVELD